MSGSKKWVTCPAPPGVVAYLDRLSKRALIDLVLDATGLIQGCEPDAINFAELREFVGPRLLVRGDREPRVSAE